MTASPLGLRPDELARVRDVVLGRRLSAMNRYAGASLAVATISTTLSPGEQRLQVLVGGVLLAGLLIAVGFAFWWHAARRSALSEDAQERFVLGNLPRSTSTSRSMAALVIFGAAIYVHLTEGFPGLALVGWVATGFLGAMWLRLRWGRRWFGQDSLDLVVLQYYATHMDDPLFGQPG